MILSFPKNLPTIHSRPPFVFCVLRDLNRPWAVGGQIQQKKRAARMLHEHAGENHPSTRPRELHQNQYPAQLHRPPFPPFPPPTPLLHFKECSTAAGKLPGTRKKKALSRIIAQQGGSNEKKPTQQALLPMPSSRRANKTADMPLPNTEWQHQQKSRKRMVVSSSVLPVEIKMNKREMSNDQAARENWQTKGVVEQRPHSTIPSPPLPRLISLLLCRHVGTIKKQST